MFLSVTVALAFVMSWALFMSAGTFVDRASIAFFVASPGQMLKHVVAMSNWKAAALLLATLAGAVVLPGIIRRLVEGWPRAVVAGRAFGPAVVATALLVAWSDAHSVDQNRYTRDDIGAKTTSRSLWLEARDERSGPVLAALLGRSRPGSSGYTVAALAHPRIRTTHAPIASPGSWSPQAPPAGGMNVIILLVESLRPDALQAFGGPRQVMPALDTLARSSLRFQRAYAQASHSDYADLCPLSSQYPLREPRHHYYDPIEYPRVLIYDLLKERGYRTAIVSSQNENWNGMYRYLDTGSLDLFFHSESVSQPTRVDSEDVNFAAWARSLGRAGKLDDATTVGKAIEWIGSSPRPFFLYMNLQTSHFPYRRPEGFDARFLPEEIDFPFSFAAWPPEKAPVVRNRYDNSLAYVDTQIARLLEFLAASGRMKNTIVVVSGDTGQAFYEHGYASHAGPLFEEVVRVPLVVHVPGTAPADVPVLAQHVDVPPTLLGLLGLPPFPGFQGHDLLAPGRSDMPAFLVVQTPRAEQLAIVHDGFKLIHDVQHGRKLLFDLRADPGEKVDLAGSDPERREDLAAHLQAWVNGQLAYYRSAEARAAYFPPQFADEAAP